MKNAKSIFVKYKFIGYRKVAEIIKKSKGTWEWRNKLQETGVVGGVYAVKNGMNAFLKNVLTEKA